MVTIRCGRGRVRGRTTERTCCPVASNRSRSVVLRVRAPRPVVGGWGGEAGRSRPVPRMARVLSGHAEGEGLEHRARAIGDHRTGIVARAAASGGGGPAVHCDPFQAATTGVLQSTRPLCSVLPVQFRHLASSVVTAFQDPMFLVAHRDQ